MVKKDFDTLELDLDQTRKERDDLVSKNEILRRELDKQEDIVSQMLWQNMVMKKKNQFSNY